MSFLNTKNKTKERIDFMLVEIIGKRNAEQLSTTSRKVAEKFCKRHDHVLRDIDNIISELGSPPKWGSLFIE